MPESQQANSYYPANSAQKAVKIAEKRKINPNSSYPLTFV